MKYGIKVGAILIGTYLVLARYTGAGALMSRAGTSGIGVIKAFQGR